MADFKKMIPFIIKWETGVSLKMGESNEALFRRAKASKSGFVDDPDDRGGATVLGVTIGTFSNYMAKKGVRSVTVNDLKNLSYEDWLSILKKMYWDRWHADDIKSQSVAELVVNWTWGSGKWGIIIPQRVLQVTDDGIVGVMTLDALNRREPKELFEAIKEKQTQFYYDIVEKTPSQKKFLNGWLNRLNDLKFES